MSKTSLQEISNAFFIVPSGLEDLTQLLDFHFTAEELMADFDLNGFIQLVPFHPDNQFGDAAKDAPENWINRSPFPMIHLLRVDEVEQAIQSHPNIDLVPEENRNKMIEIGREKLQQLLKTYQG